MTATDTLPPFDDFADIFWRLGVMVSPSQLQGYLLGLLAVGYELAEPRWLELATAFIDPVETPAEVELHTLLEMLLVAREQLAAGGMDLELLLPDDGVEISQRVDCLGQWCRGFMAGFAYGGKARQEQRGKQRYSDDVTEALNDIAAISQAGLGEGDENEQQREKDFFGLVEYLRLAVINIHMDCERRDAEPDAPARSPSTTSPADLFRARKPDDKLH